MQPKKIVFKLLLVLNCIVLGLQLWVMGVVVPFDANPLYPLAVPLLVGINGFFFILWILRGQWPFLLFIAIFLLSYQEWNRLYRFPNNAIPVEKGLKVMSYNVRLFNQYQWINDKNIPQKISQFIREQAPDVLCIQEYSSMQAPNFSQYPYRYVRSSQSLGNNGVALFSKYPLIRTGAISFEDSENSSIYADIQYKSDTLRIYNIHFESLRVNVNDTLLSSTGSERLLQRLKRTFKKQEEQQQQIARNQQLHTYPTIICTDLNNTAFSKVYRQLKGELSDAFSRSGTGFGSTYQLGPLPYRIDFIFADPRFQVLRFTTHEPKLSDHRAISAELIWR